jgi:hypothetical protein
LYFFFSLQGKPENPTKSNKMQYSAIFLAVLAASGAMAAPQARPSADKEVRVILSDLGETGSQTVLADAKRVSGRPTQSGPFKTVELKLGSAVSNKALRCQILDDQNKPIVVKRGANTDITFADGGAGAWTFRQASKVSSIVCDQAFKKIGADASEIRVVLSNQATETGSQTTFTDGQRQTKAPVGSSGPYQTVELRVGELVDPKYRCQIVDNAGKEITLTRGKNVDITFGDGDKGEWTLKRTTEVSKIICDPTFKAKAA